MRNHFRTMLLAGLALPIVLFGGSEVQAAETMPTDPITDQRAQPADGDIIVTAEKRETTLQRAPLAITALSADTLRQSNITQLSDLNGFVPGLTVANSGGFIRVISIRGIGLEATDALSAEPGTAFHINGVYVAAPFALQQDFLDVARLEVLRGPQGTVYGQNATGGAINAVLEKPDIKAVHLSAKIEGGNYNLIRATGSLNMPLTDTLAIRGTVQRYKHDGYAQQTGLGYKYGLDDADRVSARLALLWMLISAES